MHTPVHLYLFLYTYVRTYVHVYLHVCVITGLGCSFLTEQCANSSVYPYLCDINTNPVMCTPDHLSKVRTDVCI